MSGGREGGTEAARGRAILVVDDERAILDLLALVLTREVADMDTALDCATARRLLAENRYAVLLTDVRLPDGNGLDLVGEYLAAEPQGHALVMSAFDENESALESARRGADKFYAKPFRNLADFGREIGGMLTHDRSDGRETGCADCRGIRG